ncbi:MAG: DUF2304 domain-containing protein [Candidatus Komeilibacteria bacterium]
MALSLLVSLITLLALVAIWRRRRVVRISLGLAWIWTIIWLAVAVVFWWPELTNRLADLLHIGRGADVVTYGAIIVLLYAVFRLFVRLDSLDRSITTLTRELALRDHENRRPTDRQL